MYLSFCVSGKTCRRNSSPEILRQSLFKSVSKFLMGEEANRDWVSKARNFFQKSTLQTSKSSDSVQVDLNLGLSLGGCYTQEIPKENPLIRSASLNHDLNALFENEGRGFLSLSRSASMPTEAEQEVRKLKEFQAMKRMAAKKRLVEKHRHSRGGGSEEEKAPAEAQFSNWAVESASNNTALCRAIEKLKSNANTSPSPKLTIQGLENSAADKVPTLSHPPVASRTTENGKSAYRSTPAVIFENMINKKQVNTTKSHQDSMVSFRTISNGKPVEHAKTEHERPSKKAKVSSNGIPDITMAEMMRLMPSVTTTGDGPNGKKIEGFLYRYTKAEVSIVCVCHGNFLSPAEFVKHAGGTEVVNPMKHINVLPATLQAAAKPALNAGPSGEKMERPSG
ncbi:unnamed protein product [Camellia sinensis]